MSRAILVFAQVSQRRRDVPGSGRAGLHATPRGLRRYRSGLARRHAMTFFEREPGVPWPLPKTTDADLEAVLRHESGLQPGKRCIRFAHDAGAKSFVICGKFRLGTARPGARTCLSRPLPPSQGLVDIGHTDPEDGGCSISACSGIHRRHDTLAQVLRVSSPHHFPSAESTAKGNQKSHLAGIPGLIPSTAKMPYIHALITYLTNVITRSPIRHIDRDSPVASGKLNQQITKKA